MKLGSLTAKLILSITAALAMLPALAQAQHSVTFTEKNGVLTEASDLFSTITWTFAGKALSGVEHWEAPGLVGQVLGSLSWEEPGKGEGENQVNADTAASDLTDNLLPPPDGTFQSGSVISDANGDIVSASIKWIDLGDSAVPEATPTLALLGLTCLSLLVLRRFLSPQTAAF